MTTARLWILVLEIIIALTFNSSETRQPIEVGSNRVKIYEIVIELKQKLFWNENNHVDKRK
jgi:hypothetical protein